MDGTQGYCAFVELKKKAPLQEDKLWDKVFV